MFNSYVTSYQRVDRMQTSPIIFVRIMLDAEKVSWDSIVRQFPKKIWEKQLLILGNCLAIVWDMGKQLTIVKYLLAFGKKKHCEKFFLRTIFFRRSFIHLYTPFFG